MKHQEKSETKHQYQHQRASNQEHPETGSLPDCWQVQAKSLSPLRGGLGTVPGTEGYIHKVFFFNSLHHTINYKHFLLLI